MYTNTPDKSLVEGSALLSIMLGSIVKYYNAHCQVAELIITVISVFISPSMLSCVDFNSCISLSLCCNDCLTDSSSNVFALLILSNSVNFSVYIRSIHVIPLLMYMYLIKCLLLIDFHPYWYELNGNMYMYFKTFPLYRSMFEYIIFVY